MISLTISVSQQSHFNRYARQLPGVVDQIVARLADAGKTVAKGLAPVDTGALKESIYVVTARSSERTEAFHRALDCLETAKRQYIAFHRTPGRNNPHVNIRGRRRRMPHTLPEQMFPHRVGAGSGFRYAFGMPNVVRNRHQAHVVAGMYYAPFVEYPTRGRAGRFYMRRAANHVRRHLNTIAREPLAGMLQ